MWTGVDFLAEMSPVSSAPEDTVAEFVSQGRCAGLRGEMTHIHIRRGLPGRRREMQIGDHSSQASERASKQARKQSGPDADIHFCVQGNGVDL